MASVCLELMRSLLHPPPNLIADIAEVAQSDCVLVESCPPERQEAESLTQHSLTNLLAGEATSALQREEFRLLPVCQWLLPQSDCLRKSSKLEAPSKLEARAWTGGLEQRIVLSLTQGVLDGSLGLGLCVRVFVRV